ncbi:MAG: ribonuclease Z [Ruminococcaceae bacterium]|nr:ribonuclease Z [Oscillospiraceae bacterium]
MKVIVCLDDKNGMLFNKRRQSSDCLVRRSVLEMVGDSKLYMNEYSKKQFLEQSDSIVVSDKFLNLALEDDYCFLESTDFIKFLDNINTIIIYRWNRVYPSDTIFPSDILKTFKMTETEDFEGNSHKTITKEVYERV